MDMDFLESVKRRAKAEVKTIVLPESDEPRNLKAAHTVLAEGLAKVILIGNKAAIMEKAASLDAGRPEGQDGGQDGGQPKGLDISQATFIDPANDPGLPALADKLYALRKSKGMTPEEATALLKEKPLYLGCMLVKDGQADGMVSGAVHATADVLRPSLQIIKTAPGTQLVSAFFVICVPDCAYGEGGVFIFADSGLVQNPNPAELAAIAKSSAASFKQLVGAEPVVALLSHSTKGSAKHADVDKVVEATRIFKEIAPDIKGDGEFQLDAAIVPAVGQQKAPGNPVAGKANVLVFPDLDSGNVGYKLAERLAKAKAYGPITQGIAKPVNDLSRGCTAEDIVGVIAITAVQAHKQG